MAVVDKRQLLPHLSGATLDLGCGNCKRIPDSIGIDKIDYDCVDIVGDAYEVLDQIPSQSIRAVHSYHFFEHVQDVNLLMNKIARILRPNGMMEIVVPHF